MAITVKTWNGTNIETGNFKARMLAGGPSFRRRASTRPIRVPSSHPRFGRQDLQERTIVLRVHIGSGTIATEQDVLADLFTLDEIEPDKLLVVDFNGTSREISARPVGFVQHDGGPRMFTVTLVANDPFWRSDLVQTNTRQQTSSGTSWTIDNDGNAPDSKPVITLTPVTAKTAANGHLFRYPITLAHRRRVAMRWPVDLFQAAWDHAAEVTAGRSRADGFDIRVYDNGRKIERYGRGLNTSTASLWATLDYSPARIVQLAAAITAGAPADAGTLDTTDGADLFPTKGFLVVAGTQEVIGYDGIKSDGTGFLNIDRGARGSTAAIAAEGTLVYWMEHVIDVVTGHTSAVETDARQPSSLEPMIDLDNSVADGTTHRYQWDKYLDAENPSRPLSWQRRIVPGEADALKWLQPPGGPLLTNMQFSYNAIGGLTGRPVGNAYEVAIPVGTGDDGLGNAVEATVITSDDSAAGQIRGTDAQGALVLLNHLTAGFEGFSTIAEYNWINGADAAPGTLGFFTENGLPIYVVQVGVRNQIIAESPHADRGVGNELLIESAHALAVTYGVTVAQTFRAVGSGLLVGGRLRISGGVANTTQYTVAIFEGTGVTRLTNEPAGGVFVQNVRTDDHWQAFYFDTPIPLQDGLDYEIRTKVDSITGTPTWNSFATDYAFGDSDTVGKTLGFQMHSGEMAGHAGVRANEGGSFRIASGMKIWLDPAGVPIIEAQTRVAAYLLTGTFDNDTTGEAITLEVVCALNDDIEIDVAARTVQNLTQGVGALKSVVFSDAAWFRIVKGTNTLDFTDPGLVRVDVKLDWFDQWN